MKVSSKCPSFLPKASVGIQSREEPKEVFVGIVHVFGNFDGFTGSEDH